MIKNLSEYFLPEQEFYLHKVTYDRLDVTSFQKEISLNCTDSIKAKVSEKSKVKVIVTRTLSFEPEKIFHLSVAFGADLQLNPQKREEYNWHEMNLAEEFRDNGGFVTNNLMSRISLLIAQITSSYGQSPLILPPAVTQPDSQE